MKMLRGLSALTAGVAALFVVACEEPINDVNQEEPKVEIELVVDPTSVELAADGTAQRVSVDTNAEVWDYVVGASWLTVEKSGQGILLTAQPNDSKNPREGEVVIFATIGDDSAQVVLPVTQRGGSGYVAGSEEFECPVFMSLMLEYCDANGDGVFNSADSLKIGTYIKTADEDTVYVAEYDMNKDGFIDFKDLDLLRKAIVGNTEYLTITVDPNAITPEV